MFFVAEGVEGAGKSTQVGLLAQELTRLGYDVVRTREPGGTPMAERLRALVVEGEPGAMDAYTETLIFMAARRDHTQRVILPALERGAVVLCDRYLDSTHALQGAAGVPAHIIDTLHDTMIGLQPDHVFFYDMPANAALNRALQRNDDTTHENRMEKKGLSFHEKVEEILQNRMALANRTRINAHGTIEEVFARTRALALSLLPQRP